MKHLIIALILLLGFSAQAQSLQKYTRGHKMTTAEINAIDTTRADVVYRAYNTDLGIDIINRRDNQGWVPLVTAGGITDAQIAAGFLNIHPNVDLDDTDDFIVRNPETGLAKKNRLLVYNANQEADVTSTVLIANGESLRTYDDTGQNYSDFGPSGITLSSVDGTRNWYIRNKKGYTSSAVDSTSISIYPTDEFIIDKAFYFDYLDQRWEIGGQAIQTGAGGGGGTGNVSKVGTPVDNQIAVWTGDGTVEGGNGLIWDGNRLVLTSAASDKLLLKGSSNPRVDLWGNGYIGLIAAKDDGTRRVTYETAPYNGSDETWTLTFNEFGGKIQTWKTNLITNYKPTRFNTTIEVLGSATATSFKVTGQTDASNLQAGDGTLVAVSSLGNMLKSTYDTNNDGVVNDSKLFDGRQRAAFLNKKDNTFPLTDGYTDYVTTNYFTPNSAGTETTSTIRTSATDIQYSPSTGAPFVSLTASGSGDSADTNLLKANFFSVEEVVLTEDDHLLSLSNSSRSQSGTNKYKKQILKATVESNLFPDDATWASIPNYTRWEVSLDGSEIMNINPSENVSIWFNGISTSNAASITGKGEIAFLEKRGNELRVYAPTITPYTYSEPSSNEYNEEDVMKTGTAVVGQWVVSGGTSTVDTALDPVTGVGQVLRHNVTTGTFSRTLNDITLTNGVSYNVSFEVYIPGLQAGTEVNIEDFGGGNAVTLPVPTGASSGWVTVSINKTAAGGGLRIRPHTTWGTSEAKTGYYKNAVITVNP